MQPGATSPTQLQVCAGSIVAPAAPIGPPSAENISLVQSSIMVRMTPCCPTRTRDACRDRARWAYRLRSAPSLGSVGRLRPAMAAPSAPSPQRNCEKPRLLSFPACFSQCSRSLYSSPSGAANLGCAARPLGSSRGNTRQPCHSRRLFRPSLAISLKQHHVRVLTTVPFTPRPRSPCAGGKRAAGPDLRGPSARAVAVAQSHSRYAARTERLSLPYQRARPWVLDSNTSSSRPFTCAPTLCRRQLVGVQRDSCNLNQSPKPGARGFILLLPGHVGLYECPHRSVLGNLCCSLKGLVPFAWAVSSFF